MRLLAVALALGAGLAAQSTDLTQAAAAELYIEAGKPPTPELVAAAPMRAQQITDAQTKLRAIATSGATEQERALAAMALGLGESERGEELQAKADLTLAARWAPARDAATAALVGVEEEASDAAGALGAAQAYPVAVSDPFYQRIAQAAADSAAENEDWPEVARWTTHVRMSAANLWLQAQAQADLGDQRKAALAVRTLEYRYPASRQAAQANTDWQRYEKAMPDLRPNWRLETELARAWSAAGQPRKAIEAWATAAQMAPAAERAELECIEARALSADGQTEKAKALARRLLQTTQRAQALEIEVEISRRQHTLAALEAPLQALAAAFPQSKWYAVALHEAGDEAILENNPAGILKAFDQLTAQFPTSVYAPEDAWRAAWTAYRAGRADAGQRIEAYLRRYPNGADAADALYWLGIWLRKHGEAEVGSLCLRTAALRLPGTYFGRQAQQLLGTPANESVSAPEAPSWLRPLLRVRPARAVVIAKNPTTEDEIARAESMKAAGLLEPAATLMEAALREQRPGRNELGLAREVAQLEDERGAWNLGLTAILRAVPDYLRLEPAALPRGDWRLLYPIPYPRQIAAADGQYGLDRDLVLGVMREESEFDTRSLSYARARGLMQLELTTARREFAQLPAAWQALTDARTLNAEDLFNPALSIALGTADLKRELDGFDTTMEAVAAYNAGSARVRTWETKYPDARGDAFLETIPFTQTRRYVEAVLRNQAAYRQIYGP